MQRETVALTAATAGGAFYIGGIAALLAGFSPAVFSSSGSSRPA